jgi:hypothetical protein
MSSPTSDTKIVTNKWEEFLIKMGFWIGHWIYWALADYSSYDYNSQLCYRHFTELQSTIYIALLLIHTVCLCFSQSTVQKTHTPRESYSECTVSQVLLWLGDGDSSEIQEREHPPLEASMRGLEGQQTKRAQYVCSVNCRLCIIVIVLYRL